MGYKKVIVTTTINPPTEALIKYSKMEDWKLVVVGDLSTPRSEYTNLDCIYLSPEDQVGFAGKLSELIGWNCIERRNLGFLFALSLGAELIATVDDDNIPLDNWGQEVYVNQEVTVKQFQSSTLDFFDPLTNTGSKIWHRGFPLEYVAYRVLGEMPDITMVPKVQANLWNGEPDVDAIYRLVNGNLDMSFYNIEPYTSRCYTPFNSQNTIISADVIDKYFLMPGIGRISDIWAAYRLEHLLNHKESPVVLYDKPTVYQKRNEHNLMRDFKSEMFGQTCNLAFVGNGCDYTTFTMPQSLDAMHVYEEIARSGL